MRRIRGYSILALAAASALVIGPSSVLGDGGGGNRQAVPWVFVGSAAQCGGPAGSRIVTSAWLGGMGLPDNGGTNGVAATANDPHLGLLLNKNGPTTDCSSAGASITGVAGMTITSTFELGYDYRLGGHCGAGAPRFDVSTDMGNFFVGCANSVQTTAPQDPLQWARTRSVLATCGVQCSPGPIPVGAKIKSIDIVFDEGTDTANSDTLGVGLAVLDNIDINGKLITSGSGVQPGGGGRGDNGGGGGNKGDGGDNGSGGGKGRD